MFVWKKGESQTGGNEKASILSSTFEALIAAIYLDGGFNAVYPVVTTLFAPLFVEERDLMAFYYDKDPASRDCPGSLEGDADLPSWLKPMDRTMRKSLKLKSGWNGKTLAMATGSSKKDAEQNAARAAILTVGPSTAGLI